MKTSSFGHEVVKRDLALLVLPVDGPGEEEQGGEPERGAQGNKHNNQGFWKLNGVHLGFSWKSS